MSARPSVAQAERIGRNQEQREAGRETRNISVTRHSVPNPPARIVAGRTSNQPRNITRRRGHGVSLNLSETQPQAVNANVGANGSRQRTVQLRMSLPRVAHTRPVSHPSPDESTGRETEPAQQRNPVMRNDAFERLAGQSLQRQPRPEQIRPHMVRIQRTENDSPASARTSNVQANSGQSAARSRPELVSRPTNTGFDESAMRRQAMTNTRRPERRIFLPTSALLSDLMARASVLERVIHRHGPMLPLEELEIMLLQIQLMQLEQTQLHLALELSMQETEATPPPEPPKRVVMKHYLVSQAECREGRECAICLSNFEYHEQGVISLKCGHLFHESCVRQWFQEHHTCPICRTDIDEGE